MKIFSYFVLAVLSIFMLLPISCAKKVVTVEDAVMAPAPAKAQAAVITTDDGIVMNDIFFAFDKSILTPKAQKELTRIAQYLNKNKDVYITIEGHCDERGTAEYNLALGERRADSAKKFLVDLGINPSRIDTISFGEEKPVCTETTPECFQKNRRDHFVKH